MQESEIKKFYEDNKAYCSMPFAEIYNDSAGRYRLCCHAKEYSPIKKYNTNNTTPFEYFKSPEMEELRNKMLSGEQVDACRVCYKLEKNTGKSYRNGILGDGNVFAIAKSCSLVFLFFASFKSVIWAFVFPKAAASNISSLFSILLVPK